MNKVLGAIGLVGILGLVSFVLFRPQLSTLAEENFYYSYCDTPTTYKIGSIAPEFNQTETELKSNLSEAASLWNHEYGKDIFVYDPNAKLTVNLVYDGRQLLTNKISNLENQLSNRKKSLDPEIEQLEADTASFKQKLNALNAEIEEWNEKGGAPEAEFNKLRARQNELQTDAESLRNRAEEINSRTDAYNDRVSELNNTVGAFKDSLSEKPEEGIFNPIDNKIDVYFNISQGEQVHTLAHELGHSIGINHVSDPKAVMYSFSSNSTVLSQADKDELSRVCQEVPIWQPITNRLKATINFYQQLWEQRV